MSTQINMAGEQLENAFELFNQFSEKLADSYNDLEGHVTRLTKELAEARSERLVELAEKEVLAVRLEGLLDALPAGIIVLDTKDCITQTNPLARLMLDTKQTDNALIGERWDKIAQAGIISDGNELRLKNGNRAGCWINLSTCPLGSDDEISNSGKIVLISDITETRTLQNKLNRQQRLSSLGEMVASLAHQIRTPLASALLYISTLNHPLNDSNERISFARKARERLHHLERMVNDMLIFARGDVSDSEYINAYNFMFELNRIFKADPRIKNLQLEIDNRLSSLTIQANHDTLLSAIQNIIDNAIEACSDNPVNVPAAIKVTAVLTNSDQFEINIEDNGCGMSEQVKERILEPFFTTRSSGTGLGLSVVSATVSRYCGEMNIESQEGAGSRFNIRFPRAKVAGILPSNLSVINDLHNKTSCNDLHDGQQLNNYTGEQEVAL